MSMRFKPNPNLEAELRREGVGRAAAGEKARALAARAKVLGQVVSETYETSVEPVGDAMRVVGTNQSLEAASWIEFGTGGDSPTPAYAPLRRAAQAVGLVLRAVRK